MKDERRNLRILPEEFWNDWETDWERDYRHYRAQDKPPAKFHLEAGCPVSAR